MTGMSPGRRLGPRLVVAGTHSGVGKTTVATGLMAALRRAGHNCAGAKVGPDFIDPGYHALACGHPPRNLDPWLCGPDAVPALAGRAASPADLLVVEGVMGLFDGASDGTPSSTADVAHQLAAPVVLVVDAGAMSTSVAALVSGYVQFRSDLDVAGVILNRVGSDGHETLLREALDPLGVPVLGALRRDDRLVWRDRHLGLVPVAEEVAAVTAALDRLATAVADRVDLEAVVRLATGAPELAVSPVTLPERVVPEGAPAPRVAVAGGPAFTFTYTDTVDALRAAGLEVVTFDPLRDPALPSGAVGLVAGGGFPEVHAADLADNRPLLDAVRRHVAAGRPVWAECGGLLWLCRDLDGHTMAGVVPGSAHMTDRLTLGYRTARTRRPSPVGPGDTRLRGHEFHYSTLTLDTAGPTVPTTAEGGQEPGVDVGPEGAAGTGPALDLSSRWGDRTDGWAAPNLLASYLHVHPGGDPGPVGAFARACVPG